MKEPFKAVGTFLHEHKHSITRGIATWIGTYPVAKAAAVEDNLPAIIGPETMYYATVGAMMCLSTVITFFDHRHEKEIQLAKRAFPHHKKQSIWSNFVQNANTAVYMLGAMTALMTTDMALASAIFVAEWAAINAASRYFSDDGKKIREYEKVLQGRSDCASQIQAQQPVFG